MHTNRQALWNDAPAPAACSGCVGRVHGENLNTSFFRFVFKDLSEQSKPRIVRGQGQVSVAVHKTEGKVLDSYKIILSDKCVADLVKSICPLIGYLLVQSGNLAVGFPLAAAPLDLPGSVTLKAAQFCEAFSQPAGIVDQFAGGESHKAFQPNVNTDLFSGWGTLYYSVRHFQHQADIPTLVDLLDNGVLDIRPIWNSPMIALAHFAYVLDVEAHAAMLILTQFAAIAISVFNTPETIAALEAWKARLLPRFQAAEESSKGLIQAAKHMLKARCVQLAKSVGTVVAQFSEMRPLRPRANPLARLLIGLYSLFQGSIVNQPGLPKQDFQALCLLWFRAKEVFIGAKHWLSRLLLFDVPLYGFLGDLADCANVVTPAPHARKTGAQLWILQTQPPRGISLEWVGETLRCFAWVALDKQVNVVGHDFQRLNRDVQFLRLLIKQGAQCFCNLAYPYLAPIPCITYRTYVLRYSMFVKYLNQRI